MRLTKSEMQQRRETIILTAFHLFCKRGIDNVTLLEIAQTAKVGETTVYRYFENKTVLVLQAFVKLWDMIMKQVEDSVEDTPNYSEMSGYDQIAVWLDAFRQLYQYNEDFILFSYEAKLYLLRHKVILSRNYQDTLMQSVKEPCIAAFEKGRLDGSIPIKENSEDIFYAVWGTVRGYIVKIVIYDKLFHEGSPWKSRYSVMVKGVLSALRSGWNSADAPIHVEDNNMSI